MAITKFVAGTEVLDGDIDILLADMQEGKWDSEEILDEALSHGKKIVIADENLELAQKAAEVLNDEYAHALEIHGPNKHEGENGMREHEEAKEMVTAAFENMNRIKEEAKKEVANDKKVANSSAAQDFLAKHSPKMKDAQKAPIPNNETKGEKTMTKTTTNRPAQNKTQGETTMNTTANRGRQSTTNIEANIPASNVNTNPGSADGKLGRDENAMGNRVILGNPDAPWYLNKGLYPVLNRFETILTNRKDSELGIQKIALVNKESLADYAKDERVLFVVQFLANGVVLNFPITRANGNSKADFSSKSIGWVPTRDGRRPAFGHYRPNTMMVKAKCSCGNEFENRANNMYCSKCRTTHNDVMISGDSGDQDTLVSIDFPEFIFEPVKHVNINKDILALALAIAQYDQDFPMYGVVAE